jgi:hypothetical protein
MRLILILLALAIVGFLVYGQIGKVRVPPDDLPDTGSGVEAPRVPQRIEELPAFEGQMERYMDATHEERRRRLEEAMQ